MAISVCHIMYLNTDVNFMLYVYQMSVLCLGLCVCFCFIVCLVGGIYFVLIYGYDCISVHSHLLIISARVHDVIRLALCEYGK